MVSYVSENNTRKAKLIRWGVGLLAALLLGAAIYLPRRANLGLYVTLDEGVWVMRATNFYFSMAETDYFDTAQTHPGIPILWVGRPVAEKHFPNHKVLPKQLFDSGRKLEEFLAERGRHPLDMLVEMRSRMVVVNTVVLLVGFLLAWRLLGFPAALLGFLLIAFDPYHISLTKLFQLDGLLSVLLLCSSLAFLAYWYTGKRLVYVVVSGVAGGLAFLTKANGIFLIPYVGLISLIALLYEVKLHTWKGVFNGRYLLRYVLLPVVVWVVVVAAVYVAVYPAMWEKPLEALQLIYADAFAYASEGARAEFVETSQLFVIQFPSLARYVNVFLWHTTPVVLTGSGLGLVWLALKAQEPRQVRNKLVFLSLVLFSVFFILFMGMAQKRANHYVISAFIPMGLAAAIGLWGMLEWVQTKLNPGKVRKAVPAVVAGIAVVVQLFAVVSCYPYYVTYANPLMGDGPQMEQVIGAGYGEGLDVAARYLNQKAGVEQLDTLVWYAYGPFSYYYKGIPHNLFPVNAWTEDAIKGLRNADYLVIYVRQVERNVPVGLLKALESATPEKVIYLDEVEYARIYEVATLPPEVFVPTK
jgi:4-amino-4-deoxy-L-arabinose transferase-like glycosyltransferase